MPGPGVSSTPGSAAVPSPPKSGSVTIAALSVSAASPASLAAGADPRRPDDHIGVLQIVAGAYRIVGPPAVRALRPRLAQPGQVVVGIQHDGGHPLSGALLHQAADEYRLTRTGSGEDDTVPAQ